MTPLVESGANGEIQALWTLLGWVEGETLGRLPDGHEAGLIGAMLAALHGRATSWTPPAGFARPVYDAAHFERAAAGLLVRVGAGLDARERSSVDVALDRGVAILDRIGQDAAEVGLIHADVHDGNVIYGGEPRRAGLIDFERSGFGCWALDVAMAQHYLTEELHAPLLASYVARFDLTPRAMDALPSLRFLAEIDNLAVLAAIPDEAANIPAELAMLTAQAGRLAV